MDPANAKFVCGAECGIAVVGTLSAGTEHWSAVSGTTTVVTSGPSPMRSTRCFRMQPNNSVIQLDHTFASAIASPATFVGRCYVYFASLPASDMPLFTANPSGTSGSLTYQSSSGAIKTQGASGSFGASGVAVTTGQWYCLDLKAVLNTTLTVDGAVNGVALAQRSEAASAASCTSVRIQGNTAGTADVYFDDVLVSGTSGDYPIGDGTVVGLYPNADATSDAATPTQRQMDHCWTPNTDFGKGAGGATSMGNQNAEATSWQSLANPLSTSTATNWIACILNGSSEWVAWKFDDLPGSAASVNGVMIVWASHSASATSNNLQIQIGSGDGAGGFVWVTGVPTMSFDLSETTITVPVGIVASANGSAFTPTLVNGMKAKVTSSDVNPDAYLDGLCFEVDYVPLGSVPKASPYPQMIGR